MSEVKPQTPEKLDTPVKQSQPNQSTQNAGQANQQSKNKKDESKVDQNKVYLQSQKKKAQYSQKNQYQSDDYLNVKYSLIDQDADECKLIYNNGSCFKIYCYFASKILQGEERFKKLIYPLPYPGLISKIVLSDRLDKLGMVGYVEIDNSSGALDIVLERYNNFYFIINITEYDGDNSVKYEPYIFQVSSVQLASSSQSGKARVLRIHLTDVMTYILNTHSIASFIKFQGKQVTKCKSYKLLFQKILNYVKRHIKINTNNMYQFKKDLLFGENTLLKDSGFNSGDVGSPMNGYDADVDYSKLITYSFGKISRNATISQAMNVFLSDAVTSMKLSQSLTKIFSKVGDVLIPFFFKEEYNVGPCGKYSNIWSAKFKMSDKKDQQKGANVAAQPQQKPQVQPVKDATGETSGSNDDKPAQPTPENKPAQPTPQPTPQKKMRSTRNAGEGSGDSASDENKPQTPDETPADEPAETLDSTDDTQQSAAQQQANANQSKKEEKPTEIKFPVGQTNLPQYGGKSNTLVLRNMTMRDIFMPFFLAFTGVSDAYTVLGIDKSNYIFEGINLEKQDVDKCSFGKLTTDFIERFTFQPLRMDLMRKIWKNVVFLSATTDSAGVDCGLVFFDWFYKYYSKVFLNSQISNTVERSSNVIPSFYLYSLDYNVGRAKNGGDKTFDNLFDEYNSYTCALQSGDTINEALREMGKNISSFVLSNDEYVFQMRGNLLRRPNEIIKMRFNNILSGTSATFNTVASLTGNTTIYLYVKQIDHEFNGLDYTNMVYTRKICEEF